MGGNLGTPRGAARLSSSQMSQMYPRPGPAYRGMLLRTKGAEIKSASGES
jgi:hypothetical protein